MKTNDVTTLASVSAARPMATPAASSPADRAAFAATLRGSFEKQNSPGTREEQIRAGANKLVSIAFLKPLFAQMRQSPFKNEMFSGGQGEAIFGEHLDTVLADRIAGRAGFPIADAMYRSMSGGQDGRQDKGVRLNQNG